MVFIKTKTVLSWKLICRLTPRPRLLLLSIRSLAVGGPVSATRIDLTLSDGRRILKQLVNERDALRGKIKQIVERLAKAEPFINNWYAYAEGTVESADPETHLVRIPRIYRDKAKNEPEPLAIPLRRKWRTLRAN